MVNKIYSSRISEYTHENGGRVLLLFLLFFLAIYQLITSGLNALALICVSPLVIVFVYLAFNQRMFTFWALIVINYLIQMKDITLPIPMSLPNEMLEILLLAIAIFDIRQTAKIEKILNPMLLALIIWCSFCTLEILNNTCNLGINFGAWYQGARLMAFQLLYTFLVFTIYISSPKILMRYIKLWAFLSLFSAFWVWKQQNMGFTPAENAWIQTRGRLTHILNAGTLIRYFSTFSDAANYGCNAAATTVAFILFGMTTRIRKDKLLFLITGILVFWGMFASGTRTAIFCVAAGFALYIFISKSFKIAIPFTIVFGIFAFILAFTTIGNGNQQIRRMRSAFNKDDASANVREVNKEVIRKYIQDAPWGIGLGMGWDNVPANSKYFKLATIPPDSEYVFIWIRTGPIGMTMFIICTAIMIAAACFTILFRLKNASLRGIGAGFTCAFLSIQLGGYANQVIMQFPNCLIFYGGLSIVFILPELEPAWTEYEQQRIAIQEEKKRLKLEKKLAKRV